MVTLGARRHLVTLDSPTVAADGEGGYTETFANLTPATTWAAIEPATAAIVERRVGNTIEAKVTHLVTMPYHSGVSTTTRITFGSRYLYVRGIQNMDEVNNQLILACEEVVT